MNKNTDVYSLKNDATGAFFDYKSAALRYKGTELEKRFKDKTKVAEALMYACESATGVATEDIVQELKDNLRDLSPTMERKVRSLIRELGY